MIGAARVLVTGAGGQLGKALMNAPWPTHLQVVGRTHAELDLTCAPALDAWLGASRIDIVVNAGAYRAVDQAEAQPEFAFAVNQAGAQALAAACRRNGAALVHISTDYVFDGAKDSPYLDTDPMAPRGVYGRSKAAGEEGVRAVLDEHVILRTAWVYGATGRNFVKAILRQAALRDEVAVVADQLGSPTSARDLAQAIRAIVYRIAAARRSVPWGTYHCANAGWASWFTLAQATVDAAAPFLHRRACVRAICAADYPSRAPRPANSRLDCARFEAAFGIHLRPWRDALVPVVGEVFGRHA